MLPRVMGIWHQHSTSPLSTPLCSFTCASTSAVDSFVLPLLAAQPSLTCQASGSPHSQRNAHEPFQINSRLTLRPFLHMCSNSTAFASLVLIRTRLHHRCIVSPSARIAVLAGVCYSAQLPPHSDALRPPSPHFQRASRHPSPALLFPWPCRLLHSLLALIVPALSPRG